MSIYVTCVAIGLGAGLSMRRRFRSWRYGVRHFWRLFCLIFTSVTIGAIALPLWHGSDPLILWINPLPGTLVILAALFVGWCIRLRYWTEFETKAFPPPPRSGD